MSHQIVAKANWHGDFPKLTQQRCASTNMVNIGTFIIKNTNSVDKRNNLNLEFEQNFEHKNRSKLFNTSHIKS